MSPNVLGRQLRFLRPALYAVLVLDVVAVGVFAVRVQSVTRTTSTPAARVSTPVAPASPVVPVTAPVAPGAGVPLGPALGGATTITTPVEDKPTPTAPGATPTPGTGEPAARTARCPIKVKEPTTSGGLQTLIGYSSAFGPFKDEAFAAASAYQPALQLLGPVLAKYPQLAPTIEPALAPFLAGFAGLLDQGYALIAPVYAPHRPDVLEAEARLAAALAPYVQKLVTSPLGGCVVELQAALVEDTGTIGAREAAKRAARAGLQ